VLVWKFSRLARSVPHLVTALDEFNSLGFDFVSEGIDTTTAAGKLPFHVIGAVDEFFIDVLRENTRAGLASARRRGKRIGRRPLNATLRPQGHATRPRRSSDAHRCGPIDSSRRTETRSIRSYVASGARALSSEAPCTSAGNHQCPLVRWSRSPTR